MSLHIKRARTVIASIVIVVIVVVSFLIYDWVSPRITVENGSGSVIYTGEVGSSLDNDSFNLTWANATFSQQTESVSTFYLRAGPGGIDRSWDDNNGNWACLELIPVTFGGVIDANMHPNSVTFSIGTNGTNGNSTVQLESVYSQGNNVSFSQQKAFQLSFAGNGTVTSNFKLLNVPFSPFSTSNYMYRFYFTTGFEVISSLEKSFERSVNINVTLNGLPHAVTDGISIEIFYVG